MCSFIKNTILLLVASFLFAACSNDVDFFSSEKEEYVNGELLVNFDCSLADSPSTRSFDGQTVKKSFADGDVIHVIGTFQTKYFVDDGSKEETGTEVRYGALQFDKRSRRWEHLAGNELTWPSVAVSGTFKAYYIFGQNGTLLPNAEAVTYSLSKVTPETDPLYAESSENIVYGHGVDLNFNHLCTHLTLIDLEPMVSDNYFFYRSAPTNAPTDDPADAPESSDKFNNAYQFSLIKDENGVPDFNFQFCQQPDENYNGLVYVSANTQQLTIKGDNDEDKVITQVEYFLPPGRYETFKLCYPTSAPAYDDYITYDYNKIPEDIGGVDNKNTEPNLDAGKSYTLTVTKSSGVTIISPPPPGSWDESDPDGDIDVEEFLRAVCENKEYTDTKGVKVLEKTATGTKLLRNLDFKFCNYNKEFTSGLIPNLLAGSVFDGNYHYICYIGSSLFRYNYGTIQNLGIKVGKIEATSYEVPGEYEDHDADMSRHGALCKWNRGNAVIDNVRLSDIKMTIKVKSEIRVGDNDTEVHNIGCVLGSNTGKVNKLELGGTFELTVLNYDDKEKPTYKDNVNAEVLIGGIVGQNAGEGEIDDVSNYQESSSITIYNQCVGPLGAYAVGGIVGQSSGYIKNVILPKVTIDGRASSGVTSYIGGMAGQILVSNEGTASLNSCIVGGLVRAGTSKPEGAISSVSYIGGIAGTVLGVPVWDCRASVSVYGTEPDKAKEDVLYGAGGAFGRIRKSDNYDLKDLIVYGNTLSANITAPYTSYVGNFAGIVPPGQDWNNDYANKNIIVRQFNGINNIGTDLEEK